MHARKCVTFARLGTGIFEIISHLTELASYAQRLGDARRCKSAALDMRAYSNPSRDKAVGNLEMLQ